LLDSAYLDSCWRFTEVHQFSINHTVIPGLSFCRQLFCNGRNSEFIKNLMLVMLVVMLENDIITVISRAKTCPTLPWEICLENDAPLFLQAYQEYRLKGQFICM